MKGMLCWLEKSRSQTLQETHVMSLPRALWHPGIGHLWPNAEHPGTLHILISSNWILMANIHVFMGLLKKGFTSLRAGSKHPLSSEAWVQSKFCEACQGPPQILSWIQFQSLKAERCERYAHKEPVPWETGVWMSHELGEMKREASRCGYSRAGAPPG